MKKDITNVLCDLVDIPTYTAIDENHPIIKYLKESFGDCLEISVVKGENGNANLLIGINTKLNNVEDCVLLSGHIDTVKSSDGHQPKAVINGSNVQGLGSVDMKAFTASVIDNLEKLKECKSPVVLSLTSDEEYDFYGIDAVLGEMQKRNIKPKFVIVGEPTKSKFAVSNRGNAIYNITVHGKACHTSKPELGVNAIVLGSKIVLEIEKIREKYKNMATINIGSMSAGTAPNIVPDLCKFNLSIRTPNLTVLREIEKEIETAIETITVGLPKAEMVSPFGIPPFQESKNDYISKVAQKHNVEITEANFTTEAGPIQQSYPDAEIVVWGPGDPDCIHKAGEQIDIDELKTYSRKLGNLVYNYTNQSQKEVFNGNSTQPQDSFCI